MTLSLPNLAPDPRLVLLHGRSDSELTFAELAEQWLGSRRNLKESSRAAYEVVLRRQVNRWLGDRSVESLTAEDLSALVWGMEEEGYAPITIQNAFSVAKTILDYGVRRQLIAANPARLLPGRERPRVTRRRTRLLSTTEINLLLEQAREPYRTLFALGIFAGLRSGEVRGLQWGDIDLADRRLHVRRQAQEGKLVAPKTDNANRTVALLDPLPEILSRYRDCQGGPTSDQLLFTSNGKPFRAPRLCYHLRRTAESAGINQHPDDPLLRFHDLRHTAASILIAARADVAFVARQLGHATPATTLLIYAHLFDETANISRVRDYTSGHFSALM